MQVLMREVQITEMKKFCSIWKMTIIDHSHVSISCVLFITHPLWL